MKMSSEELDRLITDSEKIVDDNWGIISKEKVKKHQIRNILEMAMNTDSPKELNLFIKYQTARGKIPEKFSDDLIDFLQDIKTKYGIERIRTSLGYLYRHFVWKESSKSGDRND
jgi:hypothetical protein